MTLIRYFLDGNRLPGENHVVFFVAVGPSAKRFLIVCALQVARFKGKPLISPKVEA